MLRNWRKIAFTLAGILLWIPVLFGFVATIHSHHVLAKIAVYSVLFAITSLMASRWIQRFL